MVGYPGAGKTTTAQLIAARTGAEHIWADLERHKMFDDPSHDETESRKLYEELNRRAADLLAAGRSVVFDTSFNHRRDRDLLRGIASRHGARTVVVWLDTPADIARERALHSRIVRNGYGFNMTGREFDRIASHLEPPADDEKAIRVEGTGSNSDSIGRLLDQAT